jgi:GNAT superfamily N-acetyltransferase
MATSIRSGALRHWTVKFTRRGMEPPRPFGGTSVVVCAASRREAIEEATRTTPASPGYPVTASTTQDPPTPPFRCRHSGVGVRPEKRPEKKPAQQLEREIGEALQSANADDGGAMARVTRERVLEPLVGERAVREEGIQITLLSAVGPEPWRLVFTRGRNVGGASGGRILITLGGVEDPLAGLAWSTEHGSPYVHHVWVDPDARGRGLSRVLFDAYRSGVSPDLVVAGPFTSGGLAAARRAGATLVD